MAEELDALFGAFDGDNDNNDEGNDEVEKDDTKQETKKPKQDEKTSNDEEKTLDDAPENDNAPSSFSNLMSRQPTTSQLNKNNSKDQSKDQTATNTTNDGKKDEESSKENPKNDREIATGTSHDKTVRSYSAFPKNLPPGMTLPKVEPPEKPYKTYPFTLDPFQAQAVDYVSREESVLVAAHTSAGKTAVAEYAIAQALAKGQRVIYTSPIKALSNQKFRDLQSEFTDVGLMTGDITINPTSTALVMTTEILRSMLYRGSEVMREVAWVIYDEVHYMRDSERGVVWEESIILLPHRVRFVFLSATIPNASQFADWIAEIHHQPCHVVYTNYRPVPLQHYIFPKGGDGLHLVVDERGKFREANFQRAMSTLQSSSTDAAGAHAMLNSGNGKRKRKRGSSSDGGAKKQGSDLHRIVKLVMDRNLDPVIVFSFSKKDCERYALDLHRQDFTDDVEKDLISQVYANAIDSLSEDDRGLPQVVALLPLLKRGIGIHHGGLLPILKEIVEILFSEGLIKVLFATETFSIGINMPAKTVVFTNARKFDGKDFRWVTSGEYIQMSGRAGRRGKDDRGIVIQMLDEKMEPAVCKDILYGDPDPLNSSYKISYNMLLNMMRVEDVDPEYLLRASFYQYQREREVPGLLLQADELEQQAADIDLGAKEEIDIVSSFCQLDQQLILTRKKIKAMVQKPEYIIKYLQNSGRLIDVCIDDHHFGWGALVSCQKKTGTESGGNAGRMANQTSSPTWTLEVLLLCVDRHFDTDQGKQNKEDQDNSGILWRGEVENCRPTKPEDNKKVVSTRIFSIGLESIERISAAKLFVPPDVRSKAARNQVGNSVKEVLKRFPNGVPLLDPINDLKIKDPEFPVLLKRAEELTQRIQSHKLSTDFEEADRIAKLERLGRYNDLIQRGRLFRQEAKSLETVALTDDLKRMKRVLRRLGHVDANGVIQTKGRTACEINTAQELVVVELIFAGIFNDLDVSQCVALLSVMTFEERTRDDDDPLKGMKSFLTKPFAKFQEIARSVAKSCIACKIEMEEEEFVDKFHPGMMEAVFAWCKGAKFIEVQKLCQSYEGTTIRTLRRLEELVRQIASAAKSIGNHELQEKFEEGSELIKRDIVFCASLYL